MGRDNWMAFRIDKSILNPLPDEIRQPIDQIRRIGVQNNRRKLMPLLHQHLHRIKSPGTGGIQFGKLVSLAGVGKER
jgi:hypothetical protein